MLNLTQYVPPHHDVLDAEFQGRFPEVTFTKVGSVAELASVMPTTDILVANNPMFTPEVSRVVFDNIQRLKWMQFTTVGVDTAARSGLPNHVPITNVRGIRTGILAGHAVTLMLSAMRGMHRCEHYRTRAQWAREEVSKIVSTTEDKTIAIIGMGEIGRDVARKVKAFDMYVIGVSREGKAGGHFDEVVPRTRLHEILPRVDVLLIAAPLDPETFHLIGAAEFRLMKSSAYVVNIARGPLIDEPALIEALRTGRIAGAGIDVAETEPLPPESGLWGLENLVISPHVGGQGDEAQKRRLSDLMARNLRRFLDGAELDNVVRQKIDGWEGLANAG